MAIPPRGIESQPSFPNPGFPAPAPPPWEPTRPGMTPGPGMPPPPGTPGFPPGGPPIPGFPVQPFNPLPGLQNLNLPLFPPDLFKDMDFDLDFGDDFNDEPSHPVPVGPGGPPEYIPRGDYRHPDYRVQPGPGLYPVDATGQPANPPGPSHPGPPPGFQGGPFGPGMGQPQSFMPEDMPFNYYAGMQFGGQPPRRRRRPPSFMQNIPYSSQLGPIAGYLG